jgi:hypothetical protein
MSPLTHAIHPRPKGQGILAWLRKRSSEKRPLLSIHPHWIKWEMSQLFIFNIQ